MGLVGNTPPGWGRVQAVCDFVHQHIRFDYQQARSTRTAFEGIRSGSASAAIRPSRCRALPMPQHSGALYQRPSRRIGVRRHPMDFSAWIEVFLEGRGGLSIRATTYPRIWQDRGRARPGCGGYPAHQFVRTPHPEVVSGLDLRGLRAADDEVSGLNVFLARDASRASARANLHRAGRAPHRARREAEAIGSGRRSDKGHNPRRIWNGKEVSAGPLDIRIAWPRNGRSAPIARIVVSRLARHLRRNRLPAREFADK